MSSNDPSQVFKALANPTRRAVLDELSDGPRTTGHLCAVFEQLDRCTVMQHLRVLEDAGLVIAQRRGRERWNHLNAIPIQQIYDRWISRYAQGTAQQLAGLAGVLEAEIDDDPRAHLASGERTTDSAEPVDRGTSDPLLPSAGASDPPD